jgi:hypothetical protein
LVISTRQECFSINKNKVSKTRVLLVLGAYFLSTALCLCDLKIDLLRKN